MAKYLGSEESFFLLIGGIPVAFGLVLVAVGLFLPGSAPFFEVADLLDGMAWVGIGSPVVVLGWRCGAKRRAGVAPEGRHTNSYYILRRAGVLIAMMGGASILCFRREPLLARILPEGSYVVLGLLAFWSARRFEAWERRVRNHEASAHKSERDEPPV